MRSKRKTLDYADIIILAFIGFIIAVLYADEAFSSPGCHPLTRLGDLFETPQHRVCTPPRTHTIVIQQQPQSMDPMERALLIDKYHRMRQRNLREALR